jgi:hypothetical protein
VRCRDASGGGLNPDLRVRFAIAVTLQIEADVLYDIHEEARAGVMGASPEGNCQHDA